MPYWHKELEPRLEVTAICAQTSWRSRALLEMSKREQKPFGGAKFHLSLTGEGCEAVAAPPATGLHCALGVRRSMYLFCANSVS